MFDLEFDVDASKFWRQLEKAVGDRAEDAGERVQAVAVPGSRGCDAQTRCTSGELSLKGQVCCKAHKAAIKAAFCRRR